MKSNDLNAIIAYVSSNDWVRGVPGFDILLPHITMPCLIFAREKTAEYTNAEKAAQSIPNATFVALPGLDHVDTYFRDDLVLPYIKQFLGKVEQANK